MAAPYQLNHLFGVEGLVAVITGGGSGLGAIIAHALDANGAKAVYILGRRENSLKEVASKGVNGSIKTIQADVTSKDSLVAAADIVRKEQGYVNFLMANSGIIGPRASNLLRDNNQTSIAQLQSELWAVPMEDYTSTFHVNVTGAFYTAIAFLDLLEAANKRRPVPQTAQIVVTASIGAFSRIPAAGLAYGQSKAAAVHLVKQLSTCLGSHKIRVNALAPGFYPSEMTEGMPIMKGGNAREEGSLQTNEVPMARVGSEDDMAGLALFMASKAGAYINGAVMVTDGGRLSQFPSTY